MFELTEPEDLEAVKQGEASLPEGFWNLPETFIQSEAIRSMYVTLYRQLLEENPDFDTIEAMMIERAAALYAYMRSIEATDGYTNSSSYRQLTALWNSMANDLRKTRTVNFSEADVRESTMTEVIRIVNNSLQGFSPEIANTVRRRIALALERDGG